MEPAACGIAADTIQFTLAEERPQEGVLRVRAPAGSAAGSGVLGIDDLFPAAGRIQLEVHGNALRLRTGDPF